MSISEAYGIGGTFTESDYGEDYGEYEESGDYGEARPGLARGMRPIAPSPARNAYQPKPNGNAVTQAQLQQALARVSQQINAGTSAIKAVDTRVRNTAAEVERTGIALRKEVAERKKELLSVRKDLQSTREMSALLPLLTTLGGGSMATFAPLLLLGNDVSGSSDSSSSSQGPFSGTTGLIMLMALAGGFGGGK
ncbi:MAG: hypothetical protein ACXU8N_11765 [Telluria sp.]